MCSQQFKKLVCIDVLTWLYVYPTVYGADEIFHLISSKSKRKSRTYHLPVYLLLFFAMFFFYDTVNANESTCLCNFVLDAINSSVSYNVKFGRVFGLHDVFNPPTLCFIIYVSYYVHIHMYIVSEYSIKCCSAGVLPISLDLILGSCKFDLRKLAEPLQICMR